MQPVSTQNPLIQRARQEVLFLAGPLIDRCVEAAVTSLQEAERGGRTVALRMQLGDAWLALTRHRQGLGAAFPARVEQAIDAMRGGEKVDEAINNGEITYTKGGTLVHSGSVNGRELKLVKIELVEER